MFKVLVLCVLATLVSQSSALKVDCSFTDAENWKVLKDNYACYVYNFNVVSKEVITSVEGKHWTEPKTLGDSDVKAISIYAGTCKFVPSGFDKFFPNIEALSVWNSTLQTISSSDLKQFPKLKEIWIYENELEFLPSNLFEYNPDLEWMNFNKNKIKYIGSNLFEGLSKFKHGTFFYNVCINDEASDAAGIEKIKKITEEKCGYVNKEDEHYITGGQILSIKYVEYLQYTIWELRREISLYKAVSECKLIH